MHLVVVNYFVQMVIDVYKDDSNNIPNKMEANVDMINDDNEIQEEKIFEQDSHKHHLRIKETFVFFKQPVTSYKNKQTLKMLEI